MPKADTNTIAFPLGRLVMTANAARTLTPREMLDGLRRHQSCDWGDLCEEDQYQNELALQYGCRLVSAYGAGERKFWIITGADRSETTILLPKDYIAWSGL
jgi:hypothetical protein